MDELRAAFAKRGPGGVPLAIYALVIGAAAVFLWKHKSAAASGTGAVTTGTGAGAPAPDQVIHVLLGTQSVVQSSRSSHTPGAPKAPAKGKPKAPAKPKPKAKAPAHTPTAAAHHPAPPVRHAPPPPHHVPPAYHPAAVKRAPAPVKAQAKAPARRPVPHNRLAPAGTSQHPFGEHSGPRIGDLHGGRGRVVTATHTAGPGQNVSAAHLRLAMNS